MKKIPIHPAIIELLSQNKWTQLQVSGHYELGRKLNRENLSKSGKFTQPKHRSQIVNVFFDMVSAGWVQQYPYIWFELLQTLINWLNKSINLAMVALESEGKNTQSLKQKLELLCIISSALTKDKSIFYDTHHKLKAGHYGALKQEFFNIVTSDNTGDEATITAKRFGQIRDKLLTLFLRDRAISKELDESALIHRFEAVFYRGEEPKLSQQELQQVKPVLWDELRDTIQDWFSQETTLYLPAESKLEQGYHGLIMCFLSTLDRARTCADFKELGIYLETYRSRDDNNENGYSRLNQYFERAFQRLIDTQEYRNCELCNDAMTNRVVPDVAFTIVAKNIVLLRRKLSSLNEILCKRNNEFSSVLEAKITCFVKKLILFTNKINKHDFVLNQQVVGEWKKIDEQAQSIPQLSIPADIYGSFNATFDVKQAVEEITQTLQKGLLGFNKNGRRPVVPSRRSRAGSVTDQFKNSGGQEQSISDCDGQQARVLPRVARPILPM